ncbi:MAG: 5-formyltetrahydrofolate cyclo-ligase [Clostridiaceae bacterium]
METKSEIRRRILKERNTLSREEIIKKSALIFRRLCALSQYQMAKTVLAYMDYRNEVMTCEFIRQCICDGKKVVLPRVEAVTRNETGKASADEESDHFCANALVIYEIGNADTDTLSGYKGIPEPNSSVLRRIDPQEVDLAVIPGVAFDYARYRIGYGAGFYDRFLCCLRQDCEKAGVAYSLQMVKSIPAGKYDIPMDMVVTEDYIY